MHRAIIHDSPRIFTGKVLLGLLIANFLISRLKPIHVKLNKPIQLVISIATTVGVFLSFP